MKRLFNRLAFLFMAILTGVVSAPAQEVRNTSYATKTGERVLRIETIVPASVEQVWAAFATKEGAASWMASIVAIDLKIGGTISTHYDKNAKIGAAGTIQLGIINYIERELITFKVNLNEVFPKKAQDEDQNLQEIVQIVGLGNRKTKIVSSMIGWGAGKEWDDAYNFFAKGNEWSYKQLLKYLSQKAN